MTDRSAQVNLPAMPRGCRGGGCVVSAARAAGTGASDFPLLPTPRLSQPHHCEPITHYERPNDS